MHPDLERCLAGLRPVLEGISPDVAEASRGRRWSIAGIVEHLDLAYTLNSAGVERRLSRPLGPPRVRNARQRVAQFVVVTLGYFPPGRQAPQRVIPRGRPFREVAPAVEEHLITLDRWLVEAERVLGSLPVLDHPVLGPFSAANWRRFHWVHTRHHLKQIRAVLQERW